MIPDHGPDEVQDLHRTLQRLREARRAADAAELTGSVDTYYPYGPGVVIPLTVE